MKAPVKPPANGAGEATLFAVHGSREQTQGRELERLLCIDPALRGAILTAQNGAVQSRAGQVHAETAAAVAHLALRSLSQIGEEFGLGRTRAFHASWGGASLSVILSREQLLVCVGRASKNALATFRSLRELWK